MHAHRLAVPVIVAAALALPAVAGAATSRTVYAGPPPQTNKIAATLGLAKKVGPLNPDINAFFGGRTTINAGDTVSFKIEGFHTVDLPGTSNSDLPLIVTGAPVTGAKDSTGSPFWFNGLVPSLGLNPALLGRSKRLTYSGTTRLDSGLVSSKPFNVTFSKPGVYKFFCDVHPGMIGYVVVKAKGASIPTVKQATATEDAAVTSDLKGAAALLKVKQPKNTVSLGLSTPAGVELYSMFPATLHVAAGTVVTFKMSKDSRETHTATFGPAAYLKTLANSFNSPSFSPIGTYPSAPSQPLSESLTAHGNGFVNTGVLDEDPSTTKIGPSSKIDFTQPGTYHYQCLIHPFMQGTIVVTG